MPLQGFRRIMQRQHFASDNDEARILNVSYTQTMHKAGDRKVQKKFEAPESYNP